MLPSVIWIRLCFYKQGHIFPKTPPTTVEGSISFLANANLIASVMSCVCMWVKHNTQEITGNTLNQAKRLLDIKFTRRIQWTKHRQAYANASIVMYGRVKVNLFSFLPQSTGQQRLGTRGRALVISNTCNNTRPGSEHDYHNMRRMLDQFGFITVGDHRDYSAEVSNFMFLL